MGRFSLTTGIDKTVMMPPNPTKPQPPVQKNGNTLFIGEILDGCQLLESQSNRVAYLRANQTPALKETLQALFSDQFVWMGFVPSYFPADAPLGLTDSQLYAEYKRLYLFRAPECGKLGREKAAKLLTIMLESLHTCEAKVVEAIVSGSSQKSGTYGIITKEDVKLAFPDISGL